MDTFYDCEYSEDGLDPETGEASDVAFLGARIDSGAMERVGQRGGPKAIREANYAYGDPWHPTLQVYVGDYLNFVDVGDIGPSSDHVYNLHDMMRIAREVLPNTNMLATMGGDHSILYPIAKVMNEHHGDFVLVHYDAHPDIWMGEDEALDRFSHATPVRRILEKGYCSEAILVGVRSHGPEKEDWDWAKEHGASWHTMDDLYDSGGPKLVAEKIARRLQGKKVYLSVDIDVADPAYAPGTGTPEPGGLTSHELMRSVRTFAQHTDLIGMDVVEVVPSYDCSDITAMLANRLFVEMLCGRAWRYAQGKKADNKEGQHAAG